MLISDFEQKIKTEIDPRLVIRTRPEAFTDIGAVGIEGMPNAICTVPSTEIYEDKRPDYKDLGGNVHSTITEVESKIKTYLLRLETEPEFKEIESSEFDPKK